MQNEPSMKDIRDFRKKDDGQTRQAFKIILTVFVLFAIFYIVIYHMETDEIPHQQFAPASSKM